METKDIKQTVTLEASAHDVYEAWLDSKKHSDFTGDEAEIDPEVGGKLSLFSGYITGKTIELVPDEKIVQEMKFDEPGWPNGHYSKVTLKLESVDGRTEVSLVQTGVPVESADSISHGWHEYYWDRLEDYFGEE